MPQKLNIAVCVLLVTCAAVGACAVNHHRQAQLDEEFTGKLSARQSEQVLALSEVLGTNSGVVCAVHQDDVNSKALKAWPELASLVQSKPFDWVEERAYASWALAWKPTGERGQVAFIPHSKSPLWRPVDMVKVSNSPLGAALCTSIENAAFIRATGAKGQPIGLFVQEGGK